MPHHPFGREFGASLSNGNKIRPLVGTEKVVRKETLPFPRRGREVKTGIEAAADYQVARKLHKELLRYGINVPNFQLVVGHDDAEPSKEALYVVTEEVKGEHFFSPDNAMPKQKQIEMIESVLLGLIQYYRDKFEQGGQYLKDIGLVGKNEPQYMLGKCKTDTNERIYLLDIDPRYASIGKNEAHAGRNMIFFVTVQMLILNMQKVESRMGTQFTRARRAIIDFLDTIPPDRSSYWVVEATEKNL